MLTGCMGGPRPDIVSRTETSGSALLAGTSLQQDLVDGQIQEYSIPLAAGTYLLVEIKPVGADVAVTLAGPAGEPVALGMGAEGPGKVKLLALITRAAGDYRLVIAPKGGVTAGRLELEVRESRPAAGGDEIRVEAVRALAEARSLEAEEALARSQAALSLWEKVGDGWGEVEALSEIGTLHVNDGRALEALAWYEKALAKSRLCGYAEGEASALANIAYCNLRLKKYEDSIGLYHQALEKWRQIGDVAEQGFMFQSLGRVYRQKGDDGEALAAFQEALRLEREARNVAQQANALTGVGAVHYARGDLSQALTAFEEARELSRSVGDTSGELLSESNIAVLYGRRGQLQKAVEIYARLVGRVKPQAEGLLFYNLGAAYLELGDPEKALENYQRSRAAYHATSDLDGEASALTAIGWARQVLGDPMAALGDYETARRLTPRESWELPYFVGLAQLALGKAAAARQSLEVALKTAREANSRSREAQTLLARGAAYRALGDTKAAVADFEQAIDLGTQIEYPSVVASGLQRRATVLRDEGRLADAQADIEKAIEIIESTRRNIAGDQIRTSYLASKRTYYDLNIDLSMRLGRPAAALALSERAHARGLLDLLAEGRIDVRQGLSPELKKEEDELSDELSKAQASLREARPDTDRAKELRERVDALYERLEQLDWKIRDQNPRYAQVDPKPLTLEDIQSQGLDERTALLEYALGAERSFLFVVTREGLASYVLPGARQIDDRVRRLRTALERESLLTRSTYREVAYQLYQDLIAPAAAALAGKTDLVIVPDGALYYVPFETLLSKEAGDRSYADLPYLLRGYSISYVPSASVLAGLRSPGLEAAAAGRKRLVAFAPFSMAADDGSQISSAERSQSGRSFLPLPASSREVSGITALYSGSALKFLAGDANEDEVRHNPAVATAERLHFATHAQVDERHPELSGLVLAPGTEEGGDGFLQVYEIFNLKLSAELAVLSACETALGKEVTGEGLVGLTRAFFYAGVPSVVVSLWNVVDGPTPDLMLSFYQDLDGPGGKARALRQAKLTMISRRIYSHPAYWAPFVLVGEYR